VDSSMNFMVSLVGFVAYRKNKKALSATGLVAGAQVECWIRPVAH
jgi:hypothetical protein